VSFIAVTFVQTTFVVRSILEENIEKESMMQNASGPSKEKVVLISRLLFCHRRSDGRQSSFLPSDWPASWIQTWRLDSVFYPTNDEGAASVRISAWHRRDKNHIVALSHTTAQSDNWNQHQSSLSNLKGITDSP